MSVVQIGEIQRRGPGRPQLRSDDDTLQVVLDAAGALFRADGYAGTSMSAVAQQAGVSTKTLYRLVPTKAELFKRVIVSRIGRFILEVGDLESKPEDLAGNLERLLTAYGNLVLDPETVAMNRLVLSECNRFPEIGETFYENAVKRTGMFLAEWLERQKRAGRIQLDDTWVAAGMLRGMMLLEPQRAVMLGQANPPDAAQIAARARECAKLFLEGCLLR